jgi:hypothetical protein
VIDGHRFVSSKIQRWNVTDLLKLSPSDFGGFGGKARLWSGHRTETAARSTGRWDAGEIADNSKA